MQLLQQGGGEVLLQGLTLAVHCSSLHPQIKTLDEFSVPALMGAVYNRVAGAHGRSFICYDCGKWFMPATV
jgi:hypothetical protein